MKNSQKGFTNIILVIVVVVLVGVAGYFTLVKKSPQGDLSEPAQSTQTSEIKLGTMPINAQRLGFDISPDANHFVYRANQGDKFFVVYDGNAGKYYDNVYNFVFSPDSKHLVYIAEEGGKRFVVYDGVEGKHYKYIEHILGSFDTFGPPKFNSSGEIVYVAQDNKKQFVVIGDKEGQKYDWSSSYMPSQDGKRFSYSEKSGAGERVVFTDNEGKEQVGKTYYGILSLNLSPRGEHFAYAAMGDDKKMLAVIDGQEKNNKYDTIYSFIWSPDEKQVAYVAKNNDGKEVVVFNGKESEGYYLIASYPSFSQDGKQFAYGVYGGDGKSSFVVVNGKEGPRYNHVSKLTFSPDGTRFAYAAEDWENTIMTVIIVDGEESGRYDGPFISSGYGDYNPTILFSHDNKHIAFLGYDGGNGDGKYFVVLDGKNGKKYDRVYFTPDSFSSDGKYLTYIAISGTDVVRVVNPI